MYNGRMLRVILLVLLLIAPLFPQSLIQESGVAVPGGSRAAADSAWPIQTLEVEGNRVFTQAEILHVAGLRVGQEAGREEFEEARDRLLATGQFETVGYRFAPSADETGYEASIQVAEVTQRFAFRFEGLGVPEESLQARLKQRVPLFSSTIPATETVLMMYSRAIEEFLEEQGQGEAVVGRLIPDGPGSILIAFLPAKPLPVVADVRFVGNEVLPAAALRKAIAPAAVGSLYTETRFRQILEASLRPQYNSRGRIRVTFPKIEVEKAEEVDGVVVTVEVNEGASYQIGEVRLDGQDLPVEALLSAGDFKGGDLADFGAIEAGMERIKARLRRDGYLNVEASQKRQVNDETATADLVIQIAKGPQFRLGELRIKGLDIHAESAIKRLWTLKEGDPFDAGYPDYFLRRVREDGVFEKLGKTESIIEKDENRQTVAVTLVFHG